LIFGEVLGRYLLDTLDGGLPFSVLWGWLRYAVAAVLMTLVFALIYKWLPNRRAPLKEVLPGAVFTALGDMVTSSLFSIYISNFTSYTRIYGSIGGIIVLLLWIYLNSVIILLGGELNATVADYRAHRLGDEPEFPRLKLPFSSKTEKKGK
jgi:membrane protein